MNFSNALPFFPQRLFLRGLLVLGAAAVCGAIFILWIVVSAPHPYEYERIRKEKNLSPPITIDLGGCTSRPFFPFPSLEKEITVSFNPPRPDEEAKENTALLLVRLNRAAQSKRVTLPARIDLSYSDQEKILFANSTSPFWAEVSLLDREIEAKVTIDGLSENSTVYHFIPEEPPFLSLEELPQESPFRVLAEGRWWGRDVFTAKYGGANHFSERIEVGPLSMSEMIDLKEGEWLGWREGKWEKIKSLAEGKHHPIARLFMTHGKMPAMEGWDEENYFRFTLNQPAPLPFRVKPDELFTAIRIRSDKQISCMIEKQCFILKVGDWVFKGDGRWKVLRKKEEREALQAGKMVGEIFVFDKIDVKQGQKMIQGHLFNLSRSQSIAVELPAASSKFGSKTQDRKGRTRLR